MAGDTLIQLDLVYLQRVTLRPSDRLKSMLLVAKKMIGTSRPSGEYDASIFA